VENDGRADVSTLYIIVLPLVTLLVSMLAKGVSEKADLSKMQ
jgi:hypothetical protein